MEAQQQQKPTYEQLMAHIAHQDQVIEGMSQQAGAAARQIADVVARHNAAVAEIERLQNEKTVLAEVPSPGEDSTEA